jgi:hypothetical protein
MTNSELKSKVVTLGNKLAPRMGDRRAAFVEAWAIVKAGGLELAVRGGSFGNRQEALLRLAAYNPAAVAVMVGVNGGTEPPPGPGSYRLCRAVFVSASFRSMGQVFFM